MLYVFYIEASIKSKDLQGLFLHPPLCYNLIGRKVAGKPDD